MHICPQCGTKSNAGSIWQQRGPWLITTIVGCLIGYGASYLFLNY